MQFSDVTNELGIVQDIDYLVKTNTTTYPLKDKARNVNRWLDFVVGVLLTSDNRWQWDDTNNASAPIQTINLVDGTDNYAIPDTTYLRIERVEVLDQNNRYQFIRPIDKRDVRSQSMTEFQSTDGMPRFYDKVGGFVFLYPTPSASFVTPTAGLKIYFQRGASQFASTDTTKVPGFAEPFHRILSLGAAMDYAMINDYPTTKIALFQKQIDVLTLKMIEFYQSRNRDQKTQMRVRKTNYGDFDRLGTYNRGCSSRDKVAFY